MCKIKYTGCWMLNMCVMPSVVVHVVLSERRVMEWRLDFVLKSFIQFTRGLYKSCDMSWGSLRTFCISYSGVWELIKSSSHLRKSFYY